MYDKEITLISRSFDYDEIGNQVPTMSETTILCSKVDIGTAEFYQAGTAGLKPTLKVKIHNLEYDGQDKARFNGVLYNVMRTYSGKGVDRTDNAIDGEEIELTLTKVVGDG